jgi:hypothetical protein
VERIVEFLKPSSLELPGMKEGRHQGPRQKLQGWELLVGLVGRLLTSQGCLGSCFMRWFGVSISDSALSQRRTRLGLEPFAQVARVALRPLADIRLHPQCFFAGLRLVGIDGTQWSLTNTAQNTTAMAKVRTRRGAAAFAKLPCSALVELGTHAPLAAELSLEQKSEQVTSQLLLEHLPARSLLVLDRWYGNAPMLEQLQQQCSAREGHFLVRVRQKLAVKTLVRHRDGSATVQIKLSAPKRPRVIVRLLEAREIRARVWNRQEGRWVEVRLWTSLETSQATARELVEVYARRWEQELCYKELKIQLHGGSLLGGHTPLTAAQEILALFMACSVLAEERLKAAALCEDKEVRQAASLRISFKACHYQTVALWITLQAGVELLDKSTQEALILRVRQQIAAEVLHKRRARSCQRKVRQPVTKWPRMLQPSSLSSAPKYKVLKIA